jgi:hypothetical protein
VLEAHADDFHLDVLASLLALFFGSRREKAARKEQANRDDTYRCPHAVLLK